MWVVAFSGWLGASQAASAADLSIPEGAWKFNGDGYEGELVLKVGDAGRVNGTVYGDRIVGWYDAKTRRLGFVRMGDAKEPAFQTYQGYLFSNPDGKNVRYTLAGTFTPSDPNGSAAKIPEMGWYARITPGVPARQEPAADLVEVRAVFEGTWKFNGDGYEGDLVLKIDGDKVTGTVYGNPIAGSYDVATRRLNFVRLCVPADPTSFQAHKGYLFANQVGKKTRYTLAGTFFNIGTTAEMGWYAQLNIEPPVSGQKASGVERLDAIMLKYLKMSGGSGATLAVTRGPRTLYSRGYGWSDRERKEPIHPDTPMVTASCDKTLTAAMIRQLARDGKLDLNASVLKVMQPKPAGKVVDPRVWDVTIQHVLDHKAGWQGEPVMKAWEAYNGGKYPIESCEDLLGYVMVQKLAFTPGMKEDYDNFGYNTLKTVVRKVSGKSYTDYLRHDLCRPYGVKELKWVRDAGPRREGEPPQLWNGLIMEDPKEYRMGVSTPALCTVMRYFWFGGEPRDAGNPTWVRDGSTGGSAPSSAQIYWRSDGINVAWVFNGWAEHDLVAKELVEQAIDGLIADHLLPK
jgi:N-acyl-D-amino-acid deacylase